MNTIIQKISGILLLGVAISASICIVPITFLWGIIKTLGKPVHGFGRLNTWFENIAFVIDVLANVMMAPVLNWAMVKPVTMHGERIQPYWFGNKRETISKALAKNHLIHTLTPFGKMWVNILEWIDKGHMEKSIKWG